MVCLESSHPQEQVWRGIFQVWCRRDKLLTPAVQYLCSSAGSSTFTRRYTEMAIPFNDHAELRSGYQSQNISCFFRIIDRVSLWGYTLGLKSIIPTVLTISILGYQFILPDIIGGNTYSNLTGLPRPWAVHPLARALSFHASHAVLTSTVALWWWGCEYCQEVHRSPRVSCCPSGLELAGEVLYTGDPIISPSLVDCNRWWGSLQNWLSVPHRRWPPGGTCSWTWQAGKRYLPSCRQMEKLQGRVFRQRPHVPYWLSSGLGWSWLTLCGQDSLS